MKKPVSKFAAAVALAAALLAALAAEAGDAVPVYGPAHVALEDDDLLAGTVLELGVLAVSPDRPYRVVIGDGLTPGGIEIHPEGCVTSFADVSVATTNLDMRTWSVNWGPWAAYGDANEWDLAYAASGIDETWLRLVRRSAYLRYDFSIVDATHYRFALAWAGEDYDYPVLMVTTNLMAGFAVADSESVTYSRPDSSHLVIGYAAPADHSFISFRLAAPDSLSNGAHFNVPLHADAGIMLQEGGPLAMGSDVRTNLWQTEDEILAAVDAWLLARGLFLDHPQYGVALLRGYGNELSFEENQWTNPWNDDFRMINTNGGTWDFRTSVRPKWNGAGLATTNDIAVNAAAIAAHATATNNPHGITAAQLGALTNETDTIALTALGVASNALAGRLADYLPLSGGNVSGDIVLGTNSTTPAIVFQRMLPNDGNLDFKIFGNGAGLMIYEKGTGSWTPRFQFLPNAGFAHGTSVSAGVYATAAGEHATAGSRNSYASGYYVTSTGFASRATGGRTTAGSEYAEAAGYNAMSTNWGAYVWQGKNVSTVYGSHGDGTWNINPQDGLSGAYVGETNLADHLAAAIAPVEERVGELEALHEWPETCCIFWSDDHVTSRWDAETKSINIPTNFPTRRLELIVSDVGITNLTVNLPKWAPDRSVEIFVQVLRASTAPTNRATYVRVNGNSTSALAYTAYNQYRVVILRYDVISASWGTYAYSQPARSYWWNKNGARGTFPTDYPATVEEWIAACGARKNGTQALAMSPSLSAGHLELLDSLDALDEPNDFEPAEEVVE